MYQDYKQRGAYILTQAPLDNTVEDFWCMISQYEISTIVMLNSLKEDQEVDYASYTYIRKWVCSWGVFTRYGVPMLGHKKRSITAVSYFTA